MSSRPLRILLVAEDRRLLRQLSRFLHAFGYSLQQVADLHRAVALLEGQRPDVLLVDADPELSAALELCRRLASGLDCPGYIDTLLMIRQPTARDLRQALEAGVNDFLAKPIVYGELLVRLRAAARMLEFERRFRQQGDVEPVSGLPSRAALERRLRRTLESSGERPLRTACVLLDIDCLTLINHIHGYSAGDAFIKKVAEKLGDLWVSPSLLAGLGGGRFAALLPGKSAGEAAILADQVRQTLAATEFVVGSTALRLSVSIGVTALDPADRLAQPVLDRAAAALQSAKNSGRDCVVEFGQFDGETGAWTELAAPGKLFERTVARDVMIPWTLHLQADHALREAAALMRHAGLETAPAVDAGGKYVGILSDPESLDNTTHGERRPKRVAEAMATDVPYCEEDTSFSRLMELFTRDRSSLVVVLHNDKPTGFVTAESLALLGKPVTADSYAAVRPFATTSDYLRVAAEPVGSG